MYDKNLPYNLKDEAIFLKTIGRTVREIKFFRKELHGIKNYRVTLRCF